MPLSERAKGNLCVCDPARFLSIKWWWKMLQRCFRGIWTGCEWFGGLFSVFEWFGCRTLQRVRALIARLAEAQLTINLAKCKGDMASWFARVMWFQYRLRFWLGLSFICSCSFDRAVEGRAKFVCSSDSKQAFDNVCSVLLQFNRPFALQVDANQVGVGTVRL